jgi:transposase
VVTDAARRLGCGRTTLYRFLERHPELRQAIEDGRNRLVDLAEKRLADLVAEGHPSAVIFTLKTLGKHRGYIERQEHEISGPAGGAIRIVFEVVDERPAPAD